MYLSHMLRFLLILSLCILFTAASAVNLDSLWGVWNDKDQTPKNRLNAIHLISWNGYVFSKPDSAYILAQYHYDLAIEEGDIKNMALALNTQATSSGIRNDLNKALELLKRSLQLSMDIDDEKSIAQTYSNLGILYKNQGNYLKAIEYYNNALKTYEKLGHNQGIGSNLNNIGVIYKHLGMVPEALENYTKSLQFHESEKDYEGMAGALVNIGHINKLIGEDSISFEYYIRCIEISKEHQLIPQLATATRAIGNIYELNGELKKAMEYYDRSLIIATDISDQRTMANCMNNIGNIYQNQDNLSEAMKLHLNALKIGQENGVLVIIKESSFNLQSLYQHIGQYENAYKMLKLYITMKDSLVNDKITKEILKQDFKYKYEKEKAIEEARHQDQLALAAEREKQQKFITYGIGAGLIFVLIFAILIFNRFKVTKKQKDIIQYKNKQITESINYAKRIQQASLTSENNLDDMLDEYFIFYQPRDIVSGDFYWAYKLNEDQCLVAVCDCTGHGVPGGFMSMISTSLLNEIVIEKGITKVDIILRELRSQIIIALKQEEEDAEALDGLDMTLLSINKKNMSVDFAGAGHTLYQARGKEIIEHKGDGFPVGYFFGREKPFTRKVVSLEKGDAIYMTSDGFTEQFGGKENKLYGFTRFKNLILNSKDLSMEKQKEIFSRSYSNWKGAQKQIDDVCLMGIKV